MKKMIILLLCLCMTIPTTAFAGTSKNQKAKAAFQAKIREVKKKAICTGYKYVDLDGDNIVEVMVESIPKSNPSLAQLRIYKYKNGNAARIFLESKSFTGMDPFFSYPMNYYKKSRSFRVHWQKSNQEDFIWYKYTNGSYKKTAMKTIKINAVTGKSTTTYYKFSGSRKIKTVRSTYLRLASPKGKVNTITNILN